MATFTETFERKEVKYRLSAYQYATLLCALEGRMVPDVYGETRIMSLYLDTPERALIEHSLDKPLYKEKLRLRSYGVPSETDRVFVEIKKKFDGIVYKRRVGMSYAAARAYLGGVPYERACTLHPLLDAAMNSESLAARSKQIAREIDWFLANYGTLRASMIISCERTAYVGCGEHGEDTQEQAAPKLYVSQGPLCAAHITSTKENPSAPSNASDDVRITFDRSITYRDIFAGEASLTPPDQLLHSGEVIMEVKCAVAFPLWLVEALSACCAYPTSFSKYGEAYRLATQASGKTHRPAHTPCSVAAEAAECIAAGVASGAGLRRRRSASLAHPFVVGTPVKRGGRCA